MKYTTEDFIKKAKAIHGEKYDYSKTVYNGYDNLVKIICPKHGEFLQTVCNHLAGKECRKCSYEERGSKRRKTTNSFIEKAQKIHGNLYDYSLVDYKTNRKNVIIICKEHGSFLQTPSNHLKGQGCPMCGNRKWILNRRKKLDEFIREAQDVHGNKYDYSLVDYKGFSKKVNIICPKHGIFEQLASNHLKGEGCPKCGKEQKANKCKRNNEEFIKLANSIHNHKYDYSLVLYKASNQKVEIICPKHGSFMQTPNNHLQGEGCPKCKSSIGELKIIKYLEDNNVKYFREHKLENEYLFSNRKYLFVDFYLPDHNMIIEFNGKQHYEPVSIFGGYKSFEIQQERDNAVRIFCKEHNILLIEISYLDIKQIDIILDNLLKKRKRKKSSPFNKYGNKITLLLFF